MAGSGPAAASFRICLRAKGASTAFLVILLASVGTAAAAAVLGTHIDYNGSPSVPLGFYEIHRGSPVRRGDLVVFKPPAMAGRLIAERGYLPAGRDLLKYVVGAAGDMVCLDGATYEINGRTIATVLSKDAEGRPLPLHRACGRVPDDAAYVATDATRSFDSRYFGPVPISTLTKATPLWTF